MNRRNRSVSGRGRFGGVLGRVGWLLGVLVWLKITSMLVLASIGTAAWAGAEYDLGADWTRWSLIANVIEPHRAHFNLGTARAAAGDLPGARSELEEALRLTDPADDCAVRLNLSLVLEASADAPGNVAAEADRDRARAVIDGAAESCRGTALDPVADRLGTQPTPAVGDEPPPPPDESTVPAAVPAAEPNESELDALQDLMETAWNDRNESETQSRNNPARDTVDKPW